MPCSEPLYLDTAVGPAFALVDAPADRVGTAGSAVVVSPPWGWEEVASYRVRRSWARALAEAGHPTLRLTPPGTGDSAGSPGSPGLVAAWVEAIAAAAGWLRRSTGVGRVALLGLGLGGLVGLEAVAAGAAIDDVVLWAIPLSGRRFARETNAFAAMQEWTADGDAVLQAGLPEGWIEAGGFAMSAATMAELEDLKPRLGPEAAADRALLLGRDGVAAPDGLVGMLGEAGVETETAAGTGWARMVSHPERAELPATVVDEVHAWLASGSATGAEPMPAGAARSALEENGVRESGAILPQPWGDAFGVEARPLGPPDPYLHAVFLNAGAVRHVGPNRMWVETARAWARRGVTSSRVDLEGIGEADGEPSGVLQVGDFYDDRYVAQVRALLDSLAAKNPERRFVLVGLCAGAYWAFRAAVEDERVLGAFLVNAGALRWHPDLLLVREARKGKQALRGRSWKKVLQGKVGPARVASFARSSLASGLQHLGGSNWQESLSEEIEADLDGLRESETSVWMAFSGSEPLGQEVLQMGLADRLDRWPNLQLEALPGEDHTLRPIAAQRAARDLLDRELEGLIARARGRSKTA
ncbi:MAG: alpha/beta hydrolase [Solirubrobacterales bacterium]